MQMTRPSRKKIGEIYRLASEHLSFECSQCDEEFHQLDQFVQHIEIHLHEIFRVYLEPGGSILNQNDESESKPSIQWQPSSDETNECQQEVIDVKCELVIPDEGGSCGENQTEMVEKFEYSKRDDTKPVTDDSSLHQSQPKRKCPHCSYSCTTASQLTSHMFVHSDRRDFQCQHCPKAFKCRRYLVQHQRSHSSTGQWPALPKRPDLPDVPNTEEHARLQIFLDEKFKCEICNRMFTKLGYLNMHKQSHVHGSDGEPHRTYECYLCGASCTNDFLCMLHIRESHTIIAPYKCIRCDYNCSNRAKLAEHSVQCCGENTVCKQCGQMFADINAKREHYKTHEKLFQCEWCGYRCTTNPKLASHMVTHSEQRDVNCDLCPMKFKCDRHLKMHKKTTHTYWPHKVCDICQKTVRGTYFKAHMRRHSDQRRFECTQCDMKFENHHILRKHQLVHSNQRDFPCDLCPKMFKAKHTLVAHRRIHVNDFSFMCQWCGKGFHDNRIYKRHTLSAHGRA